jgi:hypothetical protein
MARINRPPIEPDEKLCDERLIDDELDESELHDELEDEWEGCPSA